MTRGLWLIQLQGSQLSNDIFEIIRKIVLGFGDWMTG